ncbi:hypothetical protein IQ37_17970 [Chryseobacterium piperi]|uniref:Serine aminopeptidase S33 domain-containing protein n=1 Tax=Chryseobacterium piperi TaxID=558152 RepID=A0A086AHP9_9FLAO|nr:alpha/beta hydrolase [Chryseobacterium piperi]ASW73904.1 hypothetical protein CJF12_06085 [Chryseobacterium piperi]KFF16213.1 hypothetical protein IQ37_17970 [Chryseobacterium piperi]
MKTVEIITDKGYPVSANVFESPESKTILIIASATGVKQSYYRKFSEFVCEKGISVITFDYLGIGQSLTQPIQKLNNNASDWGATDLHAVAEYAKKHYPELKITLLGHSIGGQLIGLSSSSVYASKIILVAAQSGYWKFWKGFEGYKLWMYWKVLFPSLINIFNYLPSKKMSGMENLPKNVARQWIKWCLSPDYLFGSISDQYLFYKNITAPLTSISIKNDKFAPRKAVEWITKKYENTASKRIHWSPEDFSTDTIGHFGVFREKFKDDIWPLLLNEIKHS